MEDKVNQAAISTAKSEELARSLKTIGPDGYPWPQNNRAERRAAAKAGKQPGGKKRHKR